MIGRRSCAFVCLIILLVSCGVERRDTIVIGSKNFSEQALLAEIVAQHLEARLHRPVDRRFYLAGSYICQQALLSGRIDAYVEYTGTALTAILHDPIQSDPSTVFERVKREYRQRFGMEVMPSLGFNNTFAIVVRGEDARRLNLKTIVDLGLLYRALLDKQVDLVAGNSTDGLLAARDLVILEDNKHYFPPYEAVPIVRQDSLVRFPGMRPAIEELAGKISDAEMRKMNYAVDGERRDIAEVAREFLESKGLN